MGERPQLAFFNMAEFTKEGVNEKPERIRKIIEQRKRNTEFRNEAIRMKFNQKYNVDRKRYDDVITELAEEFHLAVSTIETALKG